MSRRARARALARPWNQGEDPSTFTPDHEDDDSEPEYFATGERIDTRSAWQGPAQGEMQ